jgi:hypothetical protein
MHQIPYEYAQNKRKNFKIEHGHSEHAELSVHIRIKTMLPQKLIYLVYILTPKSPTH